MAVMEYILDVGGDEWTTLAEAQAELEVLRLAGSTPGGTTNQSQ